MAKEHTTARGSRLITATLYHGSRRRIGLVAVLLLCNLLSFGQSYYTVEYQLPTGNSNLQDTYYCFLTVMGDGTAEARIRKPTYNTAQDVLVQIKLQDSLPTEKRLQQTSPERWLVPEGTPEWLQGQTDANFKMPVFIFTETSGFYELQAAYYVGNNNFLLPCSQVVIASFSAAELTFDLASRFFYPDEPFIEWITQPGFRELPANLRNARFHLIAMAHTTDPKVGLSSQRDLQTMVGFFQNLCNQLGLTLVLHTIEGASFSKAALDAAIANVKPTANDVLIFYYSGHGFRYAQDVPIWPRLSLRTGRDQVREEHQIDVEDAIKRLRAKGARTTLVIADCCNENIGALSPQGREWLRTRSLGFERRHVNFSNLLRLFFPDKPAVIVAAAADKYQLASGNPSLGGFFSYYFQMNLSQQLYSPVRSGGWLPLMANASRQTRTQALTAICSGTSNGRCVQTPVFRFMDR